jgi:hypothetical protein
MARFVPSYLRGRLLREYLAVDRRFMKSSNIRVRFLGGLLVLAMGIMLVCSRAAAGTAEQTFDVLQIGAHTYRNVTVTTKSKDYVFILHSAGMTNVKVADLSPELRETLGYEELPKPKPAATNATAWAKQTINKLETPQVKAVEERVVSTWRDKMQAADIQLPPLTRAVIFEALGIFAAVYLFYCYCCMLICQKAGHAPGILVWLPVLKVFPLLRAAGMSRWWFLACFIPLLNLVEVILWCLNIAKARNKSILVGLLLLLPVTNILAFLYLAFSAAPGRRREDRRISVMSFETV